MSIELEKKFSGFAIQSDLESSIQDLKVLLGAQPTGLSKRDLDKLQYYLPVLNRINAIVKKWTGFPLEDGAHFYAFGRAMDALKNIKHIDNNTEQAWNNAIQSADDAFNHLMQLAIPSFVIARLAEFEEGQVDGPLSKIQKASHEAAEHLKNFEKMSFKALELIIAIESQKATLYLQDAGEIFSKRMKVHKDFADVFLAGALLQVAACIGLAWWALKEPTKYVDGTPVMVYMIQVAPRALIFSLVTTLAVWLYNRSKVNRHLELQNEHRVNALKSIRQFHEATDKYEAINKAIILQAANVIFGPPQTGFEGGSKDDSMLATKLFDLAAMSRHES